MDWIYLDSNATTPPTAEVIEAMACVNETLWANPSSVHRFGQMARQQVELSRDKVAGLVGGSTRGIVFTSGGTESNNLAVAGAVSRCGPDRGRRLLVVTTPVEHAAIDAPVTAIESSGSDVVRLPVDGNGLVTADALCDVLDDAMGQQRTVLVSIQWANNETGVIQPMVELAEICAQHEGARRRGDLLLHSDATQAVGKIPVDMNALGLDMLTLSAHKFHGPKGSGALCLRRGLRLASMNRGGPQESGRRGGTENVAGIVGLGVAADLAGRFVGDGSERRRLTAMRDMFEKEVCRRLPTTVVNGGTASARLWNTTNLGFPKLEAEAILIALSEQGVCASAGAACSSGSLEPSPVLLAAGIPEEVAHGSVRFSFSRFTPKDDLENAVDIVGQVVKKVARAMCL